MFGLPCLFIYGFSFYELIPQLKCLNHDTMTYEECDLQQACSTGAKYMINYNDEDTISNWITKYDLICMPKSELGLFGGLMLAGFFFGSIFLVRLGDIYGRKSVALIFASVEIISLIGVLASMNIIYLFVSIFIYGLTIAPCCFLAYIWALEMTPSHLKKYCSAQAMIMDSICMLILGTWFYLFKNYIGIIIILIL